MTAPPLLNKDLLRHALDLLAAKLGRYFPGEPLNNRSRLLLEDLLTT